ncbi:NAD-dependent epimerase/dehydratase family protein [Providencia vermicola]|uniref:NAD-dependent epimerase/dehydratase family protein n=1 Tax=Providencia vermicola TaxID=333965 RepID=UPI002205274C|nr:NAD-dependent epimerase/dehydratase family protein [Providencia stuartii]
MGKIVVTGGTGFIGKHLINALAEQNLDIVSISRTGIRNESINHSIEQINLDLSQDSSQTQLSLIRNVSAIVHCAGTTISNSETDCIDTVENNTKIIISLLKYATEQNIEKFIFISTNKLQSKNYNAYVMSKEIGEKIIKYTNARYNKKYTILRLCNIYGEDENITRIIPHLLQGIINEDKLKIHSPLKTLIEFCSIDVVINEIKKILFSVTDSHSYLCIKSEFCTSIFDLKNMLENILVNINTEQSDSVLSYQERQLLPTVQFYQQRFKEGMRYE